MYKALICCLYIYNNVYNNVLCYRQLYPYVMDKSCSYTVAKGVRLESISGPIGTNVCRRLQAAKITLPLRWSEYEIFKLRTWLSYRRVEFNEKD